MLFFGSTVSHAQTAFDGRGGVDPGGSIIPGADSRMCDGTIAGAIRYNSATSCAEYCNGTDWQCPGTVLPGCVSDGLLSYWSFDDGTGSATVADSAGGHDGTMTLMDINSSWVVGVQGNALEFDGTNDYVDISNFPIPNVGSVSMWIYPTAVGTESRFFGSGDTYELRLRGEGPPARLDSDQFGNSLKVQSSFIINNNPWYRGVVTWGYTTRETQMYINNSNYSSGSTLDADASGLANLRFGIRAGVTQYYQGRIDEVRIYDRVLTAGDVAVLHNSGNACQ
jgi:hypothetical protein